MSSTETELNQEQIEILKHTTGLADRGMFCGDSPAMDALVKMGLMQFEGRKAFVLDGYYSITIHGRDWLKANGE